mgnify:FL=1
MAALGAVGQPGPQWTALCACFYTLLGFTSRKLLGDRPRIVNGIATFTGAAMVVMGVILAAEQLIPAIITS